MLEWRMRVCWGNLLISSLDMRHLSRESPKYKVSLLMDNESEHCLWYSCVLQQWNGNIAITWLACWWLMEMSSLHDKWCMMRPSNGNVANPRFVWWWLVEQSSVYELGAWCNHWAWQKKAKRASIFAIATDDLMWSLSGSIANPSSKKKYRKPIKQADTS